VELEGVGTITMGGIFVEILWKVDDVNGSKGAFLWANATTNAEFFRDVSNLGRRCYLNAQLPCTKT